MAATVAPPTSWLNAFEAMESTLKAKFLEIRAQTDKCLYAGVVRPEDHYPLHPNVLYYVKAGFEYRLTATDRASSTSILALEEAQILAVIKDDGSAWLAGHDVHNSEIRGWFSKHHVKKLPDVSDSKLFLKDVTTTVSNPDHDAAATPGAASQTADAQLGDLFDLIDRDHSGYLDAEEGGTFFMAIGIEEEWVAYYWSYMLRGHDVDQDGKIDKDEFIAFVKEDLDIDEQGRLDAEVEKSIRAFIDNLN